MLGQANAHLCALKSRALPQQQHVRRLVAWKWCRGLHRKSSFCQLASHIHTPDRPRRELYNLQDLNATLGSDLSPLDQLNLL